LPAGTETAAGKLIENAFALNKFRPLKSKKKKRKEIQFQLYEEVIQKQQSKRRHNKTQNQ